MVIRGILLDLDDTLYSYPECNEIGKKALIRLLSERLHMSEKKIRAVLEVAREEIHQELHGLASSHSRLLYAQRAIEKLMGKTQPEIALEAEEHFWNVFLRTMKLYKGVQVFLEQAKRLGIKIAIVTDLTANIQLRKIIRLGLQNYVDVIITSEEAGHDKPHPAIFKLALKKLQLHPGEVIMIGDHPQRDGGARKLGIQTIICR